MRPQDSKVDQINMAQLPAWPQHSAFLALNFQLQTSFESVAAFLGRQAEAMTDNSAKSLGEQSESICIPKNRVINILESSYTSITCNVQTLGLICYQTLLNIYDPGSRFDSPPLPPNGIPPPPSPRRGILHILASTS